MKTQIIALLLVTCFGASLMAIDKAALKEKIKQHREAKGKTTK